jgi:Protein of unknown function (DUF2840)
LRKGDRSQHRNRRVNPRTKSAEETPGSIFACVRWATNGYGTAVSRIDILRAVMGGQPHSTVPYVRPGAQILLRISGWPKVERVLQAIDAIEALEINPVDGLPGSLAAPPQPHRGGSRGAPLYA